MLEICPTSNLLTKALRDEDEVRDTFRAFVEHGVAFTIATDGPEMMRTHLRDEFELLLRIGALDEDELARGEPARARGELRRARGAIAVRARNTPFGQWWARQAVVSVACHDQCSLEQRTVADGKAAAGRRADRGGLLERRGRRAGSASRHARRRRIATCCAAKLGVTRRRHIPAAYRALTGDDPLANAASA